jgi:hypothetical protein
MHPRPGPSPPARTTGHRANAVATGLVLSPTAGTTSTQKKPFTAEHPVNDFLQRLTSPPSSSSWPPTAIIQGQAIIAAGLPAISPGTGRRRRVHPDAAAAAAASPKLGL